MNPLYRIGWIFFRTLGCLGFRCRYLTPEHVPVSGPVILASNHCSYLDPPLVGAGLGRDLHYLARESLFDLPVLGTLLRRVNVVPVDRDGGGAAGLRAILNRLLAGQAILLFPEGTRSPDGELQIARSGIGLIIVRSSAPVVPVRIFGSFAAWGRSRRFPRPTRIEIKYGQPLDLDALREEARTCTKTRLKASYREATDRVMEGIRRLDSVEKSTVS
jgi:1-acyl-sn-glycerol-3-phosphate acyltransferase